MEPPIEPPDLVPRKLAALEVYKLLKRDMNVRVIAVAGLVMSSALINNNVTAGAVMSGITSYFLCWHIWQDKVKMTYLDKKYHLEPPKEANDE